MKIIGKYLFVLAGIVFFIGWLQISLAHGQLSTNANIAVQITEARKANGFLMRQYSWTSRTELIEEGQVKDTRIELLNYGPGGQLQRSLLNDTSAPLPRGFLRRDIAEQKRQEMEQYLMGLRSLLDQYTLSTAGKVLDFMNQAMSTGPDASGLIVMTGSNVVLPGDSLSVWTLAVTRQTRKIQANTFYQGNVVELTATFNTLSSGLTFMAYAEVTIPAKQMSIQVHNFDYNRTMQAPAPQVTVQPLPPATMPAPPPAVAAPSPPATPSLQTIEQKLRDLKALLDQGLISQSDYEAKKAQILQGL
jgi:hypothetical protein